MTTKNEQATSATGKTPTPEELGAGTKLEWTRRGKTHHADVVKEDGNFLIRIGRQTFKSLSSAASSISGHAERGGATWRRAGEKLPLLGRVTYAKAEAGATPREVKPKTGKAKKTTTARKGAIKRGK